jgi:uncharacterized membrane protein YeaQ/YmgE (transglycosylase-associated protein family)
MELFIWIIFGALAGSIVSYTMQGENSEYIINSILGIIGAIVAGFIVQIFSLQQVAGFYDETIVATVIGAGLVIWLGRNMLIKST